MITSGIAGAAMHVGIALAIDAVSARRLTRLVRDATMTRPTTALATHQWATVGVA